MYRSAILAVMVTAFLMFPALPFAQVSEKKTVENDGVTKDSVMKDVITKDSVGQETARKDSVEYVPLYRDPVLEEMRGKAREAAELRQAVTDSIREVQSGYKEKKRKEEKRIRFDFTGIEKPASPAVFESAFHFDPVRQYRTGACWCFSTTSFLESEVFRLHGRKIKLSEMYTVYHEFLEKGRRFVRERGDSFFDQGSEGNMVMFLWNKYGIVPAAVYKGELDEDGLYDHNDMTSRMQAYLDHVNSNNLWDEELIVSSLELIMDTCMGRPPDRFVYEGKETTPLEFLSDVLDLDLDDYICVMSTLSHPFYAFAEYEVKLNWWHSKDYYNVPLEDFYRIVEYAVKNGYTVKLNGDVSEPGYCGQEDIAVVPTFDIPRAYIDQSSREFRFDNNTTTDDHDVHLVGYTRVGDHDWFLVKDSASTAQHGRHSGYLFYRDDYIRLKMLTYIVHKDAVTAVVGRINR